MKPDKSKRIMIGVPFYKKLDEPQFQLALTNLIFALRAKGYYIDVNFKEGTVLSTSRNDLVKDAFKNKCDLLQLDDDMVFSPPDIMKIIECESQSLVIGGLYFANRPPHQPLVFKEDLVAHEYCFRSYKVGDIGDMSFRCKGVAIGVSIIKYAALKYFMDEKVISRLGLPFNFWQMDNGRQLGEDLSFCHRCNIEGIRMTCVPDINIGHIGKKIVTEGDHRFEVEKNFHYANTIPGWMTTRELNWLFNEAKKYQSIAEIGSWKGKSTHALCSGIDPKGSVWAIDHFEGSSEERESYHAEAVDSDSVFEEFLSNMDRFNNITVIRRDSLDAAKRMYQGDRSFDMVFIDADHTYEGVRNDLKAWDHLATKVISGHDYTNFPEVHRAVNDYFKGFNVHSYESIWFVRKDI